MEVIWLVLGLGFLGRRVIMGVFEFFDFGIFEIDFRIRVDLFEVDLVDL